MESLRRGFLWKVFGAAKASEKELNVVDDTAVSPEDVAAYLRAHPGSLDS
jgi:hypothetical protein